MGIDHYVKLKELGGVSGAILAEDKQNPNRRVVIKRMADGPQGMEELSASLRARHPNIVKFVESFVSDGSLYVVVKYEPGGDLDSLLSRLMRLRKAPTVLTQLTWFAQMLDALAYCHENNIIHRDVKPSNIFLSEDTKTLYLGDFGSAKTLSTGDMTNTFVGSPMWISPEVLLGTSYSHSSDVWSMGCVFYEMASLHRPFTAPSFARLVQQITSGRVAPLPEMVEDPVRAIIMSMLVQDPAKRPPASELLLTAQRALAAERRRVEEGKQRQRPPLAAGSLPQPATPACPAAAPAAVESASEPAETANFVNPEHYQCPRQGSCGRSNSASAAVHTPDQLAGSMYTSAGAAVAAAMSDGSPLKPPPEKVSTPPPPPAVAAPAAPPPSAQSVENGGGRAASASYDSSLSVSDDVGEGQGEEKDGAADDGDGRPVSMFVAITPRKPRKKKAPVKAKKNRAAAAQQLPTKAAPATPPPPKALSRNPSLVPSDKKPPFTPPPASALNRAAEVRTFSPKQLGLNGQIIAPAPPSPGVAATASPATQLKREVASALQPKQLQGFRRTPTADAMPSSMTAANGRIRSSTLTPVYSESAASHSNRSNALSSQRGSGNLEASNSTLPYPHNRDDGPQRAQAQPPQQMPKRALAAALEHRTRNARRHGPPLPHPTAFIVKKRPPAKVASDGAQPRPPRERAGPAASKAAPRDSDSDSSSDGAPAVAPDDMRKSQWIRAKRDDVSDIESYLKQFRGHDEEVLLSYDAISASAGGRRRPSLVGQTGAAARSERTPPRRGRRQPSPEAIPPPPPPQQWRRGVTKSSSRADDSGRGKATAAVGKKGAASPQQLRRLNSSVSNLNSTTNSLGQRGGGARQASNAHVSQPKTLEEQQRIEEERKAARDRREAERKQMAEMIREQREQRQKQRKQKKKTDSFGVEVMLPRKA